MKQEFVCNTGFGAKTAFRQAYELVLQWLAAGPVRIIIEELDKRSLAQNALMWALLSDIAKHVEWHGMALEAEDWKEMISAVLSGQRSVPSIEGKGFVILGARTSKMTKKQMGDMIEACYAFGSQQGIVWGNRTEAARAALEAA
jgi:hypothetical protein